MILRFVFCKKRGSLTPVSRQAGILWRPSKTLIKREVKNKKFFIFHLPLFLFFPASQKLPKNQKRKPMIVESQQYIKTFAPCFLQKTNNAETDKITPSPCQRCG